MHGFLFRLQLGKWPRLKSCRITFNSLLICGSVACPLENDYSMGKCRMLWKNVSLCQLKSNLFCVISGRFLMTQKKLIDTFFVDASAIFFVRNFGCWCSCMQSLPIRGWHLFWYNWNSIRSFYYLGEQLVFALPIRISVLYICHYYTRIDDGPIE